MVFKPNIFCLQIFFFLIKYLHVTKHCGKQFSKTDRQTDIQTNIQTYRLRELQTERQTDRQTHRQKDRQTGRQSESCKFVLSPATVVCESLIFYLTRCKMTSLLNLVVLIKQVLYKVMLANGIACKVLNTCEVSHKTSQ